MKMTFRWYGENDPISLSYIRQIPNISGVVTAIYDIPVGETWDSERLIKLRNTCEENGLSCEVIESVPVHEDIKLGLPSRKKYVQNYAQTIKNLGKIGVKCVCYNFMPVFDWLRTNLNEKATDGSYSLSYCHEEIKNLDPTKVSLPGWDESYKPEQLKELLKAYNNITREQLFENLVWFLKQIMPACDDAGVSMAIHPDDPPWGIFGLPRIMSTEKDYDLLFERVPNRHNGMTFCTGSLGAGRQNNIVAMAEKFAKLKRIPFAHLRNIKFNGELDFCECGHLTSAGSLDICGIVSALVKNGFDGYVRPDHGRNIWDENGKPGYGLYDRALGAAYLNGLFEMAEKGENKYVTF